MGRAVLLVTLVHLTIFGSCSIFSNEVDVDLTGSFSDEDLEPFRYHVDKPISQCKVTTKHYLVNETRKVSWFIADTFCRDKGMELVSIGNADEYWMLVNTINALEAVHLLRDAGVWTSGFYDTGSGQYRWMTRQTPMDYTVWRPGRPGTKGDRKKCVELRKYDQYKMNDVQCGTENYIACQKEEHTWRICDS